ALSHQGVELVQAQAVPVVTDGAVVVADDGHGHSLVAQAAEEVGGRGQGGDIDQAEGDVLAVHGLAGGLAVHTPGKGVKGNGGHDAFLGLGEERVLDVEAVPGDRTVVFEDGNDAGSADTRHTLGIEDVGDIEAVRPSSPTGLTSVLL